MKRLLIALKVVIILAAAMLAFLTSVYFGLGPFQTAVLAMVYGVISAVINSKVLPSVKDF